MIYKKSLNFENCGLRTQWPNVTLLVGVLLSWIIINGRMTKIVVVI